MKSKKALLSRDDVDTFVKASKIDLKPNTMTYETLEHKRNDMKPGVEHTFHMNSLPAP